MEIENDIMQLIQTYKIVEGNKVRFTAPRPGKKLEIRLKAPQKPEHRFVLSIVEGAKSGTYILELGTINRKTSMQMRDSSNPLVRVDLDKHAIHSNPDGTMIHGSHIHIATHEYGDKWAFPLNRQSFLEGINDNSSAPEVFERFRMLCGVDDALELVWSLGV